LIEDGAPQVVIDPAADNIRARHAYARAGFVSDVVVSTESGPVVVMIFRG
jgi:hypothetical protein